jgi:SAM-dependent methyltransferase
MTVSDPKADQYARAAEGWAEQQYANSAAWFAHRAELVISHGPRLEGGDEVLELACGDAALGEVLLGRGLRYRGVDITPEMVAAARARLGERAEAEVGDLWTYVPPAPVAATALFRALYYVPDRPAFFRHVAGYTERKLVFDFSPRRFAVDELVGELTRGGFSQVALRPFFVPTTFGLPRPLLATARMLERSGPLARLALRFRFTYVAVAWR